MTRTHPGANDWRRHGVNFGAQLPSRDTQLGTRAVIYPHVSALQPAVTDRSIAAQREACLRTAAELGFSIIDDYVVADRPVRKVAPREAFRRLRTQARKRSTAADRLISISHRSRRPGRVRRWPCTSSKPTDREIS